MEKITDPNDIHIRLRELRQIRRFILLVMGGWIIIIAISLSWNLYTSKKETLDIAVTLGREFFRRDVLYRRWNALQGGVYGAVSEMTQPNPYLKMAERDIETPSGIKLTKINPAFMTRQVHDLTEKESGLIGHITSLNPIRPENSADEWETAVLLRFEEGETEISEVADFHGRKCMRFMKPLITEQNCLSCHAEQGYRVGDVRGGIAVAVPLAPLFDEEVSERAAIILSHLFITLAGLIVIFIGRRNAILDIREIEKQEDVLIRLQQAVQQSPSMIGITDIEGKLEYVNDKFIEATGYREDELIGQNPRVLKSGLQDDNYYHDLWVTIKKGKQWKGEFQNKKKDGQVYWESALISPIRNSRGEVTHYIKLAEDISKERDALIALKASEENYRHLVDASYDAMVILRDREFVFFNRAFLQLSGYRDSELKSLKMQDLISEDISTLCHITDETIKRIEVHLIRSDKNVIDVEVIASAVEFHGNRATFLIMRDITEQKRLLKTMQASQSAAGALEGLIPICASCKNIREEKPDHNGKPVWVVPEKYISDRIPKADFTHSICPDCIKKLYPDYYENHFIKRDKKKFTKTENNDG